jgi:branched-chain amino acid transport system substrate-binding protein
MTFIRDEEINTMKRLMIVLCPVLILSVFLCAGGGKKAAENPKSSIEIDDATREVLRKINSVSAYEVPNLRLREDENYAKTTQDVEPFRYVKPYKQHFLLQMEYTGPGRAIPEPNDIETVKLGFIGPIMSTVSVATGGKSHEEPLGIKMLQGARLAIEQANTKGGYLNRNIPFELVISNDNGLWGASGNEIIKMAYKEKVWAILGTIDGANSHIAIRVALKSEIVILNSGDTDPTFIETNIPWVFRNISDDRQQSYLLIDYIYKKLGLERIGIIRSSNRYGRFGVREIRDGSRRLGHPIILEMSYAMGTEDFSLQLERLKNANLDAIIHWGDAPEGAHVLNQMRSMGMKHPYFACDRCLCDKFVEIAGPNAEGVICTYPWNPTRSDTNLDEFRDAFRKRFGEEAETFACHAYDGMNMLIWAVQVAGLNRAKIRDVLAYRAAPFKGVTGDITLSACLDDVGDVYLAKRENSGWKFYSREDIEIPRDYVPIRDRVDRPLATAR